MEPNLAIIMAIAVPVGGLLGVLITNLFTKGSSKAANSTSFASVMVARINKLESTVDEQSSQLAKSVSDYNDLKAAQLINLSENRNLQETVKAMVRYITVLREHIINNESSPPPRMSWEIREWFDNDSEVNNGLVPRSGEETDLN